MCVAVNDPISDFELLGRGYYCTSQIKKNGEIRTTAFYPGNKEDEKRKGYFTNKISMCRICRDVAEGNEHQWTNAIKFARNYERKGRIFKGFAIASAQFLKNEGLDVEPAASDQNPFHMHLVIPGYEQPYRKVESVSELLTEDLRPRLEDLRHKIPFLPVEKDQTAPSKYPTPCDLCKTS